MSHQASFQETNHRPVPSPSLMGRGRAGPAPRFPSVHDIRPSATQWKDGGIGPGGDMFPADALSAFEPGSSLMRFAPNQALFSQSEASRFVHVVAEGVVRVQRTLCDGRRLIARFAFAGDAIGLWTERDSRYSAEALGPVTTRRMPRGALLAILESRSGLRDRLRQDAERELALTNDRLMMLARCSAREKVAAFLVQMRDRWLALNGQSMCVALPMSRQDIGDFLGVTLETVSRMISAFARERLLVVVPDGVRLIDLPRLRAIGLSLKSA